MHELGISQQIVEAATEKSGGRRVTRIVLEIGKLSGVLPDAIRFCFGECTAGTAAEGAKLEIIELPGLARCLDCSKEIPLDRPFGRCACGNSFLDWISGDELKLKEMEVA